MVCCSVEEQTGLKWVTSEPIALWSERLACGLLLTDWTKMHFTDGCQSTRGKNAEYLSKSDLILSSVAREPVLACLTIG